MGDGNYQYRETPITYTIPYISVIAISARFENIKICGYKIFSFTKIIYI